MSNNLVSQSFSVTTQQIGQMEPISNLLGSTIPSMQMELVGSVPHNPLSQQMSATGMPMSLASSPYGIPGSHQSLMNVQMERMETKVDSLGSHQFLVPVTQHQMLEPALTSPSSQQLSASNKRRAPAEQASHNPQSQQFVKPNKRVAQVRPVLSTSGVQPYFASNKSLAEMPRMLNGSGSQHLAATNKKMGQMDSIYGKSVAQQANAPKNRTPQTCSPKPRSDTFESVRSKLRESLASSLELVIEQQNKPSRIDHEKSQAVSKDSQSEASPGKKDDSTHTVESISSTSLDTRHVLKIPLEHTDGKSAFQEIQTVGSTPDSTGVWKQNEQEFQASDDVSYCDSLFVKDELLQGNGLTWALEFNNGVTGTEKIQPVKKQKLVEQDAIGENPVEAVQSPEKSVQSPQVLAFQIEAELFELFGGVNKKYKEKGRSLLFNLKDRSNPELRERVMSGEISPKQLCSMSAEELASKELSEWRIAKAEELAQMVVLPDTEVDVRRLVRKTHKGEFQVEVEQDDSVSVEVSVGASLLTRELPRRKEKKSSPSKSGGNKEETKLSGEKANLENQNLPSSFTIFPNEGTDPMQGLIVDESKDAEPLPPIVSLDEFMESLDSEPPFENLPVEAEKKTPTSDKGNSGDTSDLKPSDQAPKNAVDITQDKPEKVDAEKTDSDVDVKPCSSPLQSVAFTAASKGELVWEGSLQLSVSALASVNGFLISGEKTSTKVWPSLLEIKGRVRLDAFGKFIQELPNSRSRAIMVVHFLLKDESRDSEKVILSEAVESYASDERLGFSEPAPGVELYICPPNTRIFTLLCKNLPKEYAETPRITENSLIGVVVWRKVHLTNTISPKSSSHNKHSLKRHNSTSRRQQEQEANWSPNLKSHPPQNFSQSNSSLLADDNEDDVPPGFGPASRDEDDLPEFKFSSGSKPQLSHGHQSHSQPPRAPVHPAQAQQMRELVLKYGKSGTADAFSGNWTEKRGSMLQWDDEDDDIPEWQPHVAPKQQALPPGLVLPQQLPMHGFQQQQQQLLQQTHLLNHSSMPLPAAHSRLMQPSMNLMQGTTWGAVPGSHVLPPQSTTSGQVNGGQIYGSPVDWRQGAPRHRGL